MATVKTNYTAATSLASSALPTLAAASYATSAAISNGTNGYDDYQIEVDVTVGTVAGNKQILIFAIDSVDGTNYSDSTQQPNMVFLDALQTPVAATSYRSNAMSIAQVFGGKVPPNFEIVCYNDSGVALTAGTIQYVGVYTTIA